MDNTFKIQLLETTAALITAAFGLVAALAWNLGQPDLRDHRHHHRSRSHDVNCPLHWEAQGYRGKERREERMRQRVVLLFSIN